MLRISICSVMPAADMNHAAVASADIASCHDAAHVTTAGIAAPTNIAFVILLLLVVLLVFGVKVPSAVLVPLGVDGGWHGDAARVAAGGRDARAGEARRRPQREGGAHRVLQARARRCAKSKK
jgi:hypothetical protein